jgi:hypothetical protein
MPPVRAADRALFLEAYYPSYPAYAWLNRTQGSRYRVYGWRDSFMAYFADGEFLGDWFGPARYLRIESVQPDGGAVCDTLQSMGVGYLVVPSALGPARLPTDSTFQTRARMVFVAPGARVFALDRSAAPD